MSEIQRPAPLLTGELRAPYLQKHRVLAELARMQKAGEIAFAHNPRRDGNDYVVDFVRLREPRAKLPRYAAIAAAILTPGVAVGMMLYHARYVIGAFFLTALLAAGAFAALAAALESSRRRRSGHCPGAWHR